MNFYRWQRVHVTPANFFCVLFAGEDNMDCILLVFPLISSIGFGGVVKVCFQCVHALCASCLMSGECHNLKYTRLILG